MGAAAGVGAEQHLLPLPGRELRQREPGRLDMVRGSVRARAGGPQQDGQGLPGPVRAVVGERGQRV